MHIPEDLLRLVVEERDQGGDGLEGKSRDVGDKGCRPVVENEIVVVHCRHFSTETSIDLFPGQLDGEWNLARWEGKVMLAMDEEIEDDRCSREVAVWQISGRGSWK